MNISAFNLRHLRAVVAIADHGSISGAARAVSITQPAISQGLARLESLLGEVLFERRRDGMVVTQAGEIVVSRGAAALEHIRFSRVTMAQMQAFVSLARAGSYVGAAQITGLSQPSLHRAVSDLAIAARRILVDRHGKSVRLTDQGHLMARNFRLAEAELRACLSELAGLRGESSGRIVIGAMPLSRARILPAACASFAAERPGVVTEVVEGAYADLAEPLRDGEVDLMIGAVRSPLPQDLEQQILFEDRPAVFGRAGHPLAGSSPGIDRLASCPWVVPPRGVPLRDSWEGWFREASLAPPHVPIECGSVITIREILRATDFLTVLSRDQVLLELKAGWIEKIAEVPRWFHRTIGFTTRAGWRPTRAHRLFMEHVRRHVKDAAMEASVLAEA